MSEHKPISEMTPEEQAQLQAESAAHIAGQQAEFAESQESYTGEAPPVDPASMTVEELYERGLAPWQDMTSPGGPWHGLPHEAQFPDSPDFAENCRWACVQGSFFAYTLDGTGTIGDHAENVRGYGIATDAGNAYMRNLPTAWTQDQRVAELIKTGNQIAYQGINIQYTVA